jgi:Na+/H+ antiporter NhaD/arsenite permease-like protein
VVSRALAESVALLLLAATLVFAVVRPRGLPEAAGRRMAAGARGRPVALLGLVFVAGSAISAVLSLDATVVLLTPVVFATAIRLQQDHPRDPRPPRPLNQSWSP